MPHSDWATRVYGCPRKQVNRQLLCRQTGARRLSQVDNGDSASLCRVLVKASPEAVRIVRDQGGRVYVWAKRTRCCGGSVIFLETSSEPGERSFRRVSADGIEVYLDTMLREPEGLELDVGGLRGKHVHAYWEGCAYMV
jgi:hypothetical protein